MCVHTHTHTHTHAHTVGYYTMDMHLGKLWEMVRDRGLACCSLWSFKELDMA